MILSLGRAFQFYGILFDYQQLTTHSRTNYLYVQYMTDIVETLKWGKGYIV